MNVVVMQSPGDPGVLAVARAPVPRPGEGQVLIRVQAIAVSSRDLLIRSGRKPHALPDLFGSDAAGEVIVVGRGVTDWSRGDRVIAVGDSIPRTPRGAYSDYQAISSADLQSIPDNVSFLSAASVGRTFATAWVAIFGDGRFGMNERVVVIGADQPTGIAAVQICRWKDSTVIAVANGRHAPRLAALGVTRSISQSAPDLADHVSAGLDAQRATAVINISGSALSDSLRMLDRDGRLVLTGGGDPQPLDIELLVDRQAHVIGASRRVDTTDLNHILKLLGEGTFIPVIDSIFPLSQAARAHQRAEAPQAFGTVLLVPDHLYDLAEEIPEVLEES